MSNEIYIAKQETLLETKTKVDTVQNTLVETETKVEAVQNTLSETKTKVEAAQNTLSETNTKVEAVQNTVDGIMQKPSSGGGQIVFPSKNIGSVYSLKKGINLSTSDTIFFVDSQSTLSGRSELHIFKYQSTAHFIWDGINYEQQPASPRVFDNSTSAISGAKNLKLIHFLGGNESYRHDKYDVKTRTWSVAKNVPVSCTNGIAIGECFSTSRTAPQLHIPSILYIFGANSEYLYEYNSLNDTYKPILTNVRKTINAKSILWCAPYIGGLNRIVVVGGDIVGTSNSYSNAIVYNLNDKTSTELTVPFSITGFYSSAGFFVNKVPSTNSTDYYSFNGTAFSSGNGYVKSAYKGSKQFTYIDNNVVHEVWLNEILVCLYMYEVYLPKNTKIYCANYYLNSSDQNAVDSALPYFPTLKIVGDAFVVEQNGVVPYCAYIENLNLNTCLRGANAEPTLKKGFYIEIGSGE